MWKNFKENLSKCLKKRELMTRSGAASQTLPECKLFNELLFLKDKVTNQPTVSNLQADTYSEVSIDMFSMPPSPIPPSPSPKL